MSSLLSGIKIAVVGGDDREIFLINELVKMGATVVVAGFPREKTCPGALVVNTVEEAAEGVEVLILPLPGTNAEGVVRAVYAERKLILNENVISKLSKDAIVIIGQAREFLRKWTDKYNLNLLEIIELDELAILNSIPTAEGAIQIAMEETATTIHGSKTCIIGYGRVAITLARVLKALGAEVTVLARDPGQRARAYEMGCNDTGFEDIREIMNYSDIVFNTVPFMVLDKNILKYANPKALIIDLAAQPGGTDFEAANSLGIKAILAPGLPGKVAPAFAGKILAGVIPRLIMKELAKQEANILLA